VRQKLSLVIEVVVNIVLPWLCYRFAKSPLGETGALLLSTAPPILWSLVTVLRFRRLDVVSVFVIVGILLSLVTMALGGSSRVLLMRESLVTGFAGLALIASLLLPRPLMFLSGAIHGLAPFAGGRGPLQLALGKTSICSLHVPFNLDLGNRINCGDHCPRHPRMDNPNRGISGYVPNHWLRRLFQPDWLDLLVCAPS
jgi:hypothetical protein